MDSNKKPMWCDKHNETMVINYFDDSSNWVCMSCANWLDAEKPTDVKDSPPKYFELTKVQQPVLPLDSEERKRIPIATGVLDYFPNALAEIAKVSFQGNIQHNPGQPLHWARSKSKDHADTIIRHFLERGTFDKDGIRHSAKLAWRILALLQMELEAEGAPLARGAKE